MNKFRIKLNDLESPSARSLHTHRSNPDLRDKAHHQILKGGTVPRNFWFDVYGQSGSTFYMTQVTQLHSTKNNKYADDQNPNKNANQVGNIIKGVNKAVHRLKALKQFKGSQDFIQKVENKSEESVDSNANHRDDSFNRAYRNDKVYTMKNVGDIVKKSVKTSQTIAKQSDDRVVDLQVKKKQLYSSLNQLLIQRKEKEAEMRKLKIELAKIKNGGKSDVFQVEKLKQETQELLDSIAKETQNHAIIRQENNVLRNMMMTRKQDMMTLTRPFNDDMKRLKQVKDVVRSETKYLNNSGKIIDQLRYKLEKEEQEQSSMRTFLGRQMKGKSEMVEQEKLVQAVSSNLIGDNREKEKEKKSKVAERMRRLEVEDEERSKKIEGVRSGIQELEEQFRVIQNVIADKQEIGELVSYHDKLQEDRRVMIEQCAGIEQKIEDTKYQIKLISQQFQTVKISKLEFDPNDVLESLLEDDHILQKLSTQLRSNQHQIMFLKEEIKSNDQHLAAYSKGFHAMVSANVKGFSDKLNHSQRQMISFQADHLSDLFLKMLDSLKKIIQEEPDYFPVDSY